MKPNDEMIIDFSKLMKHKMDKNNHKRDSWGETTVEFLLFRLEQEKQELLKAIQEGKSIEEVSLECADVANIAMLIAAKMEEKNVNLFYGD